MKSAKNPNQQHHSPVSFLKNLLIVHWRSLLLLFIGVYLPLQVFEILAVKIWQNKVGFPDVPILLAVHSTAKPELDVLAVMLAKFGSFWTALPILSAIAVILLLRKRWRWSRFTHHIIGKRRYQPHSKRINAQSPPPTLAVQCA